jgi:hypothetical protein
MVLFVGNVCLKISNRQTLERKELKKHLNCKFFRYDELTKRLYEV